jgi:hypothetical protein
MGAAASSRHQSLGWMNWTQAEDSILLQAVSVVGTQDWKQVAKNMGPHSKRSDQECFHRWSKVLYKCTTDHTDLDQNKPIDAHDIVGLHDAFDELKYYAAKYPRFQSGLLRACQEQIRVARKLIEDSDIRGAVDEDLIKISEGLVIDIEPFLELEEKDLLDPKIELECLHEAKKLAVQERKFERAGKLLQQMDAAQGKLDEDRDRKIGQIMKAKKMIKRLKEYVKQKNAVIKELTDNKEYAPAAAIKRRKDRALCAHHKLIKFVTRFTPNKIKEASEAEMMKKVMALNYHQLKNVETLKKNLQQESEDDPPYPAPMTTGHPLIGNPVTQGWRPIDDPQYRHARLMGDRFYKEENDGQPLNVFGGTWRK